MPRFTWTRLTRRMALRHGRLKGGRLVPVATIGLLAVVTAVALNLHGLRSTSPASAAAVVLAPTDAAALDADPARQQYGSAESLAAGASGRRSRVNQQPNFPIRATFYYPWYPEVWTVNGSHVFYHPVLGYYDSSDPAVQRAHIAAMTSVGLDAAITSWWGFPNDRDTRFKELLDQTVAMNSPLKWAVYHEGEGRADPTPEEIAVDLTHIEQLAESPAYLRVDGRFVVFVYNAQDTDRCGVVDRWNAANELIGGKAYIQLLIFPGYRDCSSQPDSWHEYAPAHAASERPGYSYMVSPGFWRADEPQPRLERDLTRWKQNVRDMVASGEPWQFVVSFNEWGEGTAVEPSREWGATYLAALRSAIRSAPKP